MNPQLHSDSKNFHHSRSSLPRSPLRRVDSVSQHSEDHQSYRDDLLMTCFVNIEGHICVKEYCRRVHISGSFFAKE